MWAGTAEREPEAASRALLSAIGLSSECIFSIVAAAVGRWLSGATLERRMSEKEDGNDMARQHGQTAAELPLGLECASRLGSGEASSRTRRGGYTPYNAAARKCVQSLIRSRRLTSASNGQRNDGRGPNVSQLREDQRIGGKQSFGRCRTGSRRGLRHRGDLAYGHDLAEHLHLGWLSLDLDGSLQCGTKCMSWICLPDWMVEQRFASLTYVCGGWPGDRPDPAFGRLPSSSIDRSSNPIVD